MENEVVRHHKIIKVLDKASNRTNKKFAQFRKCVFHVHTPASHDYRILGQKDNRKIKDAELLNYAIECNLLIDENHEISDFDSDIFSNGFEGLSYLLLANKLVQKEIELVVVTDHNTIEGFTKLVESLKILKDKGGREIKKYPQIVLGVEISCSDKNHIVGIFNHLTTTSKLSLWLDEYIMSPKDGTYLTSIDVLEKIQEFGGVGYIAHVNSSDIFQKGYLSQAYKNKLFNSMFLNLLGLSDLSKENRISDKLKNFTKRKFNYILDEDSHSIMELGEKHFWIKAQKLGFYAIKNAMKDFDISTSFEEPIKPEGFIKALYIDNKGFLSGKNTEENFVITFSEAMNSFIGGRGTGKSTVLNTLDFLLSQSIESETILRNICSQGASCLLYSYKNEDYYIFFNGSGDKQNDQSFILKYYNYTENSLYAVPLFDNKRARNIAIKDRINVYKYNGVKPILIKHKYRDILNNIYSHMFSVNDLVTIASGKNINSFIIELMSKSFVISKQKRINSKISIKWLKNKNDEMPIILSERLKEVMSLIEDFNHKQNNKLRIVYYQKKMSEVEFPWIEIFNITSGNGTTFFRKYNISKIDLYSYLKELTSIFNPLEVVILFYERRYGELIEAIDIGQFLNRNTNNRMIDAGIEKIDSNNIINFMDEVKTIIEGSLNVVTNYVKEYIHAFDDFNLEFNIHNKEMNSTKKASFKRVSDLSMGQKVVAMLSFILAYSDYSEDYTPLIIDQPEDNLDNQYIYKNLVNDLRRSKSQRQVIVATHNSTIVTNTGSEQVIVMESDNESGWVETTGYPTEINITKQIINKLEGGEDAFRQKVFLYDEVISD